ncbi:MAG: hypothetical protein INF91_05600 [Alphaproteobacteria bacterium]|nr:hypothetical protein [Alphaproteobacteria bacterium]
MAKVIKSFKGVPDGKVYPIEFAEGDTVEGELAEVAIAEGWAEAEGRAAGGEKPAPKVAARRRAQPDT